MFLRLGGWLFETLEVVGVVESKITAVIHCIYRTFKVLAINLR